MYNCIIAWTEVWPFQHAVRYNTTQCLFNTTLRFFFRAV